LPYSLKKVVEVDSFEQGDFQQKAVCGAEPHQGAVKSTDVSLKPDPAEPGFANRVIQFS
jgi:hypothetical protein